MKKLVFLFTLCLIGVWAFGQDQVPNMIQGKGQVTPLDGPGTEFYCTAGSLFSQDPDADLAITSDVSMGYKVYDNFWGISGSITSIDWWGITATCCWSACTEDPKTFEISFYQDNAGSIGSLVSTFSVTVTGNATGATLLGIPILKYSTTLTPPVSGLSSGWVSIQGNPAGTCAFLWLHSLVGDDNSYQEGYGWRDDDLAFCLYDGPLPIPLSNWAIYIGIFLIAAFMVFRFRRRLA